MLLAVLAISALGGFLWFAFTFAVYAMPLCVGIYVGTQAYHSGAGVIGAIVVGLVVAGLVLGLGEFAFSRLRSTFGRAVLALAYVGPATYAGYHATNGIVKHMMPSENWQVAFSVVGAIVAGFVSFARLASTPHVPVDTSPGSFLSDNGYGSPAGLARSRGRLNTGSGWARSSDRRRSSR